MRESNMSVLGDLIKTFYHENNRDNALKEQAILDSWRSVVGDFIVAHTVKTSITNGVLYVKVDADSLRNELVFSKSTLLKNLNKSVDGEILKDIVIR